MRGKGLSGYHNNLTMIDTSDMPSLEVVERRYVKMLSPGRLQRHSDGAIPTIVRLVLLFQINRQQ
jgi:N-methylhydantoinase B/oxoprolinase/acetone carboxylase alpha subunit